MHIALIQNAALLVALSVIHSLVSRIGRDRGLSRDIMAGVLFGGVAVAGMNMPFHYRPGIIYDGRSIVLALAGLFGGGTCSVVSIALAGAYRVYLGGSGVWAGLATIFVCPLVGLAFRRACRGRPETLRVPSLYALGVLAHVAMLACQMLLPSGLTIIGLIGVPVMLIFPVATLLIGLLLGNEERRIHAERQLSESEARFRDLFHSAPVGYHELDIEGRITRVNRTELDMLGYGREEMLGRAVWEFIEEQETSRQVFADKIAGETPPGKAFERTYLRRDGTTVPVLIRDHLLRDQAGHIVGVRSTIQDISQRRQAEDALRKSEEKHRVLFESSRDAIMTLAPPSWRFTSGNPAIIEMFGVQDEADFVSRALWEYSPPNQPDGRPSEEKAREMIETAMREGAHLFDWRHQRLDGEEFPATVLLTRFELAGNAMLQATVRDVSSEKQLEAQLRESQKMEAIGRLAGGVAHDFNNILTAISGFTELAIAAAPADSPLRKDLAEVLAQSERAANLTGQLLAFSRQQTLEPVVIGLNEFVGELSNMLEQLIEEDIDLVFVAGQDLGHVKVDQGQIEQVLMNLTVNAKDAMPDGGKLTIETGNVVLDREYAQQHPQEPEVEPGEYVVLSVSDTGQGMDAETREQIFEPFFTTREQGQGTGLGLSTAYGIVKQHGGSISVYSEVGQGTTFKVYLPRVHEEAESRAAGRKQAPAATGSETILVVEDEASVLKVIQRWLEDHGYTVWCAIGPREAEAVFDDHADQIALLLSDVVMPECNGKVLYDRLRAKRPALKVLYMSGYTDNAIAHRGVLDKGTPFIHKPLDSRRLLEKLRDVLDRDAADNGGERGG